MRTSTKPGPIFVIVRTSVSNIPERWILMVFTAWKTSTTCSAFTLSSTVYSVQNAPVRPRPSLGRGGGEERRKEGGGRRKEGGGEGEKREERRGRRREEGK